MPSRLGFTVWRRRRRALRASGKPVPTFPHDT